MRWKYEMCDREEILTVGVIMTHQVINTDTVTVRGHAAHNKYSQPRDNSTWELSYLVCKWKDQTHIWEQLILLGGDSSLNPILAQQMTIHRLCSQSFSSFSPFDPPNHRPHNPQATMLLCCVYWQYCTVSKLSILYLSAKTIC